MFIASASSAKKFVDSVGRPQIAQVVAVRANLLQAAAQKTTPAAPAQAPSSVSQALGLKGNAEQGFTVGQEVISFDAGVTAENRQNALDATLFAQLVADKESPDRSSRAWWTKYYETLSEIGCVLQDQGSAYQKCEGTDVEVDQAIIGIITAALGVGAGATVITTLTKVLNALKNNNAPFITLFNQETNTTQLTEFQVSLASQQPAVGFLVNLFWFSLSAAQSNKQVLFFKWSAENALVAYRRVAVSFNEMVFSAVRGTIEAQITAQIKDMVHSIHL